jgi:hypothetical protein
MLPFRVGGESGTVFCERCPPILGGCESLSGPRPFRYARVIALHDVSSAPQFIELAILPVTAGRNGEQEHGSAVPLDALQHREEGWSEPLECRS